MDNKSQPVDDIEVLLRTNFAPEHIKDGLVIPTAISRRDLSERGFSVDREKLCAIKTILERIDSQMSRLPDTRKEAFVSSFLCGKVRQCVFVDDGIVAFKVNGAPIPENLAHAVIMSSTNRSDALLKKLKMLLLPLLQEGLSPVKEYTKAREPEAQQELGD